MPGKDPATYDLDEVCIWLNAIGLGSKTDAFRENAVDGSMLVTLQPEDMVELGLSSLQGKKVMRSVELTKQLANESSRGGGAKLEELGKENASLKKENAELRAKIDQLKNPSAPSAAKPKPKPKPSPAPAPVIR